MFILFNAFGDDFEPANFVKRFQIVGFDTFEKGSPLSFGGVHKHSRLSKSLKNAATIDEVVSEIEVFIKSNNFWLSSLKEEPVTILFNVGVVVGGAEGFVPCLELAPDFLRLVSEVKIGLHIYMCPGGDDDGDG